MLTFNSMGLTSRDEPIILKINGKQVEYDTLDIWREPARKALFVGIRMHEAAPTSTHDLNEVLRAWTAKPGSPYFDR